MIEPQFGVGWGGAGWGCGGVGWGTKPNTPSLRHAQRDSDRGLHMPAQGKACSRQGAHACTCLHKACDRKTRTCTCLHKARRTRQACLDKANILRSIFRRMNGHNKLEPNMLEPGLIEPKWIDRIRQKRILSHAKNNCCFCFF